MTSLIETRMTTKLEQLKRQFDRSVLAKNEICQGKLRSRENTEIILGLLLLPAPFIAGAGILVANYGHSIGWLLILFGLAMGMGGFIYDMLSWGGDDY